MRLEPTRAGMVVRGDHFAGAEFSADGRYRYRLWRMFDYLVSQVPERFVAFVMLNPSTADESKLDPTLRRCEGFAKRWGYNGFQIANVFALRSTDPKGLLAPGVCPVGQSNAAAIRRVARSSEMVIAGWGASVPRDWEGTVDETLLVIRADRIPHHLGLTKDGHPRHPLYLRGDVMPRPWEV